MFGTHWRPMDSAQRVRCPRRDGDEVDLSRCLGRNWLLELDRSAGPPRLRCAADADVVDPTTDRRRRETLDTWD